MGFGQHRQAMAHRREFQRPGRPLGARGDQLAVDGFAKRAANSSAAN
jgi:hypothetical protein